MQLHEFDTLAQAQAYVNTSTEIFSASTMRLYLRASNLYLYLQDLFKGHYDSPIYKQDADGNVVLDADNAPVIVGYNHHAAKADVSMLFESLNSPNADGQDFNFIQGKAFGDGNIAALDDMIANTLPEKSAELELLKSLCIARSNKSTQPYALITQVEFDEAKAAADLVSYPASNPNGMDWITTVDTQGLDISATCLRDGRYPVYLHVCADSEDQTDRANYTKFPMPAGYIDIVDGRGVCALSSKKVRSYNYVTIVGRNDSPITASVVTNRG